MSKRKSFWCDVHTESMIMKVTKMTQHTQGWTIRFLIEKGFKQFQANPDSNEDFEARIQKLNEAWKREVDIREKEMLELTEKINRMELAMERSPTR